MNTTATLTHDDRSPVTLLRRDPVQERAQQRLNAIRTAARHVIATVGRDRLTTQLVADRAGCSIGTVYRYFADRVALLDDLYPNRCEGLTCTHTQETRRLPENGI